MTATIHTNAFMEKPSTANKLLQIASRFKKIGVVNMDYLSFFPELQAKFCFIPNAVDTSLFKCLKSPWLRSFKTIQLFFPNIPLPKKSLATAIQTLVTLNSCCHDISWRLFVAGNCPDNVFLPGAIKEKINFLGVLSYPKGMIKYYNFSDVVVVPSKSESSSLVTLEAMACGVPVVAGNVSGLNNTIKDQMTGLIVPSHAAADWAKAISCLCQTPELYNNLSCNALFTVSTNNTFEQQIVKYLEVWELCA